MATENIKYSDGVKFGLALIPTGNQPLDARTIVTSLPAKASDFEGNAAYEGMTVSLLPDHKIFMLTSSLEDILDNKDLVWKEVGADQEIPSLDGYATEQYVDDKITYLNSELSSLISTAQTTADNAQTAANNAQTAADNAQTKANEAYNIAYTIAYTEGVDGVIDTIKDIAYWINEDPAGAVSLVTRVNSAEEDIAYLEAGLSGLVEVTSSNKSEIDDIKETIAYIQSNGYDDSALRDLITTNS